jgi:hypothetical protein
VFGYDNLEVLDASGQGSHVERRINEPEAAASGVCSRCVPPALASRRSPRTLNEDGAPAPTPAARAPSTVRPVLLRELLRGVMDASGTAGVTAPP